MIEIVVYQNYSFHGKDSPNAQCYRMCPTFARPPRQYRPKSRPRHPIHPANTENHPSRLATRHRTRLVEQQKRHPRNHRRKLRTTRHQHCRRALCVCPTWAFSIWNGYGKKMLKAFFGSHGSLLVHWSKSMGCRKLSERTCPLAKAIELTFRRFLAGNVCRFDLLRCEHRKRW